MICLRCGYCCMKLCVVIVNDPDKGIRQDNLRCYEGNDKCQHLQGNKPGEYSCAVHDRLWYKKTPCFSHVQIERNKDDKCRMGVYLLKKEGKNYERNYNHNM